MQDMNFGCCSSYRECSDAGKCIKPDLVSICNYWIKNLSQGRNFYSVKPKLINDEGYLYLIVDGRAFRIYKASKNNYSYALFNNERQDLESILKRLSIKYSTDCTVFECSIKGTPQDPAFFRVNFSIGDKQYNIKNYNGYEITRGEAMKISRLLPSEFRAEAVRWYEGGYFKSKLAEGAPVEVKETKKTDAPRIEVSKNEKPFQLSIFDMMAAAKV